MVKRFEWYPGDDEKKRFKRRRPKPTRLRQGIEAGTVLILLAGRFRGKRVVFLKQLPSGMLLVTGPYKVNGVPLKRVNQAYVLKTTTKVDVSGAKVDKIDDKFFARSESKAKSGEERFFAADAAKKAETSDERKNAQKEDDGAIIKKFNKKKDEDKMMLRYLHARFTLTKGMYPHELKF